MQMSLLSTKLRAALQGTDAKEEESCQTKVGESWTGQYRRFLRPPRSDMASDPRHNALSQSADTAGGGNNSVKKCSTTENDDHDKLPVSRFDNDLHPYAVLV